MNGKEPSRMGWVLGKKLLNLVPDFPPPLLQCQCL